RQFRRLDITYCRLDGASVTEIRKTVQWMAQEFGVTEEIEVEGDDQFSDSLAEGEEEEGEEHDEDEEEEEEEDEEEQDTDQFADQENDHHGAEEFESLEQVTDLDEDELAAVLEENSLAQDTALPAANHSGFGTSHDAIGED
ncbi:hypothetical protein BGZ83_011526, partial [Gryganskiella cystojenkinii]